MQIKFGMARIEVTRLPFRIKNSNPKTIPLEKYRGSKSAELIDWSNFLQTMCTKKIPKPTWNYFGIRIESRPIIQSMEAQIRG
jgi:hypothetical protein